ncbi:hypothetical protein Tco_1101597 [Tanacetum coccineum]
MNLMQFLMRLDDSYMQIRSFILSREVLPDVRSVYAIISSVESHRVASGSIASSSQRNQASTFVSNVPNRSNFQRNNQYVNSGPPRPNNLNNNRQDGGSALVCENWEYVSNNNSVGTSSSSGFTDEQMATLISLIKDNKNRKNVQANTTWANQHMTYTNKELDNALDISHLKIKVGHPNRSKAFISKIENLKLSKGLMLYDVLVIPEYCVTLIFVDKLAKENKVIVAFDESRCYFLNQDWNLKCVLGTDSQCEGLGHLAEPVLNVLKESLQFDDKNQNVYYEIYFFDVEYPELLNDDERVEPKLNSDQRSQSANSSSFVSGEDANTADFPVKSRNDADSSDNIFATQNKEVTTL